MAKRWLRFGGLAVLLGFLFVPAAHADTRWSINVGIGAPRAAVAPPGYVWQPAHYEWTGYGNVWIAGRWIPAPAYRYRDDNHRWDDRGRRNDRDRYDYRDGDRRHRDGDDWRR